MATWSYCSTPNPNNYGVDPLQQVIGASTEPLCRKCCVLCRAAVLRRAAKQHRKVVCDRSGGSGIDAGHDGLWYLADRFLRFANLCAMRSESPLPAHRTGCCASH